MVREVCNIDSSIELIEKGRGQNNCGDVITGHLQDAVAAFSLDSSYAPLNVPSRIFDPVNQKDKEYRMIEGVGDQALVTTFSSFHTLADNIDTPNSLGYALHFSSAERQRSGTLRMYNSEFAKADGSMAAGCSLEETKQLARRIVEE